MKNSTDSEIAMAHQQGRVTIIELIGHKVAKIEPINFDILIGKEKPDSRFEWNILKKKNHETVK